jgi:trans-2,3-dihydro-3-hydroxyanthranilate isomerase
VAVQFLLVDVFTSTPYRGNSLTVFPDAGGLGSTQMAQITGELRQFESIFLNPAGPQHHWRTHIFDLFEELDFAGHPVIGAAAVLHHRHGGDAVHGRWTMELTSGALTVETERRGRAAYLHRHGLLGDDHATELGQGRFINRPSRITISARSVGGEILVRVGGEVVLVGSGQLDVLPS